MKLKGSETEKNLMKAFLGESDARNRYTFYASQAKKDGFEQISAIFIDTADNESQHAKQYLKYLGNNEPFEVCATLPIGLGDTVKNLELGVIGESEEHSILYPAYGQIAIDEGFKEIGETFNLIAEIEGHHQARFQALYENIANNQVFKKEVEIHWVCMKCGYIKLNKEAPEKCPVCHHPQAYFEMLCDNF